MNNLYFHFVLADNDVDADGEAFTNNALDEICKLCIGHSGLFDGYQVTARITDAVIMDSCGTTIDGRSKQFIYASAELPNNEEGRNLISRIMNNQTIASISCSCKHRDAIDNAVTMLSGITDFYNFSLRFEEDEDMTKDELKTRLESAEKQNLGLLDEIKNLKAQLAEMQDEPEIPDFPEFKAKEIYWFCDTELKPHMSKHCNYTIEDFNEFHTETYAQEFANKCKLIAMMLHCKWYLCREYEPDWDDETEEKWQVCYRQTLGRFTTLCVYTYKRPSVFFDTIQNAQKCADWLNKHWRERTRTANTENDELKRLLRLAITDIAKLKNCEKYPFCVGCPKANEPYCEWVHNDEAMKLLGGAENAEN